jgi:hypothetical protein
MKFSTPLYIVICAIIALLISVWWQFNGAKNEFAGIKLDIPDFEKLSFPPSDSAVNTTQNANPYKDFSTPDAKFSFKYPADYQGAENLFGQEGFATLQSNNIFLFVYKVSIPDLQPSYIIALESDATSTEAAIQRVKESFGQQQCDVTAENATSTNPAIFSLINASYVCRGAQKGYEQWRAQAALVGKENGFYAVAAVSTAKNWPAISIETQSLFNSIKVSPATSTSPTATTTFDAAAENQ